MAYTCIIDTSNEENILPEFEKTVCKIGESRIDSRVSLLFQKSMNILINLFSITKKVSKIYLKDWSYHSRILSLQDFKLYFMLIICSLSLYCDSFLFMLIMCSVRLSYNYCLYFDSEYPLGDFLEESKFNELSEFLKSHCQKKRGKYNG